MLFNRYLYLNHNNLEDLPGVVKNLYLEHLEVCGNPFSGRMGVVVDSLANQKSLKEIASVACIKLG